jgi:hypothetical protein
VTALLPALLLVVVVFGALYLRGGSHKASTVQRGRAPHIFEESEVPAEPEKSRWLGLLRGLAISHHAVDHVRRFAAAVRSDHPIRALSGSDTDVRDSG